MPIPSINGRWYVDTSIFHLIWHQWEGNYAVFHTGSAETHILDTLAAKCLQLLQQTPLNIAELSKKLSDALSLDLDDDLYEYVDGTIQQFELLGLIEQKRAFI